MSTKKETTTVSDDWVESFFGDDSTTSFTADASKKEEEPETKEDPKEEEEVNPLANMGSTKEDSLSMGDVFGEEKKETTDAAETTEETEEVEETQEVEETEEEAEGAEGETEAADVIGLFNTLIEDGELFGFEDGKLESIDDVKALIKANIEESKGEPDREGIEKGINDYVNALPKELRVIHDYTSKGGQDVKGLLKSLSEVEEIRSIDDSTDQGRKDIVRQHLLDTKFGTAKDIEEQIEEWEDLNKLEKKATQYKPILERKKEKQVQATIAEQENIQRQRREAEKSFINGIQTALDKEQVGSVNLPKTERDKLLSELTTNKHVSEINQRPLNVLGKVLEEITFVKPDYDRLAEITYFAMDREGFLKNIAKDTKEKETGNTMRKLKVTASGTPAKKKAVTRKPIKYNPINK